MQRPNFLKTPTSNKEGKSDGGSPSRKVAEILMNSPMFKSLKSEFSNSPRNKGAGGTNREMLSD